jgi:hypothetical protein
MFLRKGLEQHHLLLEHLSSTYLQAEVTQLSACCCRFLVIFQIRLVVIIRGQTAGVQGVEVTFWSGSERGCSSSQTEEGCSSSTTGDVFLTR